MAGWPTDKALQSSCVKHLFADAGLISTIRSDVRIETEEALMAGRTIVEKAAEKVGYGLAMAEDIAGSIKSAVGAALDAVAKPPQEGSSDAATKMPGRAVAQRATKKAPAKNAVKKTASKKSASAKPVAKKPAIKKSTAAKSSIRKSPAKKAASRKAAKKTVKTSANKTRARR